MFIDEGIVQEFLEYPEKFRLVIEGFTNPSVQFYIGRIDYETYLFRITQLNITIKKNYQLVCKWNEMDFVHDVI